MATSSISITAMLLIMAHASSMENTVVVESDVRARLVAARAWYQERLDKVDALIASQGPGVPDQDHEHIDNFNLLHASGKDRKSSQMESQPTRMPTSALNQLLAPHGPDGNKQMFANAGLQPVVLKAIAKVAEEEVSRQCQDKNYVRGTGNGHAVSDSWEPRMCQSWDWDYSRGLGIGRVKKICDKRPDLVADAGNEPHLKAICQATNGLVSPGSQPLCNL